MDFRVGDRIKVTERCTFSAHRGKLGDVTRVVGDDNIEVRLDDGYQLILRAQSLGRVLKAGGVTTAPRNVTVTSRPAPKPLLPHDSAERKTIPLYSVLFGYFPDAMVALAKHSYESNEKHNPGEELHWSRGKSDDHADAAMRHLVEGDYVGLLWRAAALLQLELEAEGHAVAPLAR